MVRTFNAEIRFSGTIQFALRMRLSGFDFGVSRFGGGGAESGGAGQEVRGPLGHPHCTSWNRKTDSYCPKRAHKVEVSTATRDPKQQKR